MKTEIKTAHDLQHELELVLKHAEREYVSDEQRVECIKVLALIRIAEQLEDMAAQFAQWTPK